MKRFGCVTVQQSGGSVTGAMIVVFLTGGCTEDDDCADMPGLEDISKCNLIKFYFFNTSIRPNVTFIHVPIVREFAEN